MMNKITLIIYNSVNIVTIENISKVLVLTDNTFGNLLITPGISSMCGSGSIEYIITNGHKQYKHDMVGHFYITDYVMSLFI